MTVTGDSRTLRPEEPSGRATTPEVLIPEAKRRAKRRRRRYTAVLLLAVVGVATSMFLAQPGQQLPAASDEPPVFSAPDIGKPAGILAMHGIYHFGWVLVYEDGRVIQMVERGTGQVMERRLTPAGIERVRSGAVHPGALISQPESALPADTWADSAAVPYVAARYAACYEPPSNMEARMGYLPVTVQGVLRRSPHTYKETDLFTRSFDRPRPYLDCAELSPAEANYVGSAIVGGTLPGFDGIEPGRDWCATVGPPLDSTMLCLWQVLPHGSWVLWGG
ncbi:hypothetical protein [Arthrobacter cupressi]|uniref:Uncharacterized protein n=1 Tax=Arthrobacter cupressi TaxID=1045773 RepID=A0A1G8Q144_9MICC|nr:hypothetical protein [Arthrobacter cupressi]NYD77995.1 hypothetical protein [Arthrobacter cupressi]SDI98451.1 hypothetical protein SAMN05216555_10631 [Arthrobacter cupressi]